MAISFSRRALKELRSLPKQAREAILNALERVEIGDVTVDVKPMAGQPTQRVRVGKWRAVFRKDENGDLTVIRVGSRGDVYKG